MMASNSPDVQASLHQAMDALTRGDRAQARDLLTTVIEMDDRNEQAWLWMSGAVDSPVDQRICLENVLTINPGSTAARQGLAYLEQQAQAATDAAAPPAALAGPATAPEPPAAVAPAPLRAATPTVVLPAEPPAAAPFSPAAGVAEVPEPPVGASPAGAPWERAAPPAPSGLGLPDWAMTVPAEGAGLPEWASAAPDGPGSAWGDPGGAPDLPVWAAAPVAAPPAVPGLPAWAGPPPVAAPGPPGLPTWAGAPAAGAPSGPAAAALPDWGAPLGALYTPLPETASASAGAGPAPATPADPWEGLRTQVDGGPAPGSAGAARPDAEAPAAAGPAPGVAPVEEEESFGGLAPFDFDPTAPLGAAPAPAAPANPWSHLDAARPAPAGAAPVASAPLFHPEGDTGTVVALDSPWAGTFAGSVLGGTTPAPPSDDPFLHIRQPVSGDRPYDPDDRMSSPAMIGRPPVTGRAAPAPTSPCPSCGELVTENALSCPRCQYRFYAPCPHCGDFIDLGNPDSRGRDKCPRCGQPVNKLALGQAAARNPSRRTGGGVVPVANPAPLVLAEPGSKKKLRKGAALVAAERTAPATSRGPRAWLLLLRLLVLVALLVALIVVVPLFLRANGVQTVYNPRPTPMASPTR